MLNNLHLIKQIRRKYFVYKLLITNNVFFSVAAFFLGLLLRKNTFRNLLVSLLYKAGTKTANKEILAGLVHLSINLATFLFQKSSVLETLMIKL